MKSLFVLLLKDAPIDNYNHVVTFLCQNALNVVAHFNNSDASGISMVRKLSMYYIDIFPTMSIPDASRFLKSAIGLFEASWHRDVTISMELSIEVPLSN